jgi:hypothetical protein
MTLGVRPPRRGASRADGLRFIRDLQVRSLLFCLPAFVLAILAGAPGWALVLGAVALAALVLGQRVADAADRAYPGRAGGDS